MKKKVAIVLAGVMLMGCLTGCSESVTAEDLIEGAFDTEYVAYDVTTNVEMIMEDSDLTLDMDMAMVFAYECSPQVCHIKGELEMVMEESSYGYSETLEEEANGYFVLEDDVETKYYFDYDYDDWFVEEQETDGDTYIPSLSSKMFEDLELEETDDGYEVTGLIKKQAALFGTDNAVLESLIEAVEDCDFEVIFTFTEDKELETYSITVVTDEDEIYEVEDLGEVSISEFEIIIEVRSTEGSEVEVPAKVEQNAISPDEVYDTEEETETEDETELDPEGITLGTITDTTYENAYLNIGWVVPSSDWTMFTREEIDSVYNTTIDIMGEDYAEALETAAVFYDMVAMNEGTYDNINVVAENMAQYQGAYSEEDYANVCLTSIKSLYEEMGYTDITMSLSTIEFMGETHPCIISEYTVSGMVQYQLQSYVTVNDHMVIITATSNESIDACSAMYESFYRLGM